MTDVNLLIGKFEEIRGAVVREIGDEHGGKIEKDLSRDSDIMRALVQYEKDELEDFFADIQANIKKIRGFFIGETGCYSLCSVLSCHTNFRTIGKIYLGQV